MALNKEISGKADIQSDKATFYYIKPREALWINDLYTTVDDDQSILAVNPLYLVGPHNILPNPVLEFNPTIAAVVTAAFEEPTTVAKVIEVAEHIVMMGKKQFDMMMGGDQESNSASSLTTAITHVKLEPPDESAIPEDAGDSRLPEDTQDIADVVTLECNTIADKVVNTPAIDDASASVPLTTMEPDAQAIPPRASEVVVNPNHMNFLLTLPYALTNHLSILDHAYGSIMDTFFLHICIRHAESLRDLNACQAAVNKAIQLWTDAVS